MGAKRRNNSLWRARIPRAGGQSLSAVFVRMSGRPTLVMRLTGTWAGRALLAALASTAAGLVFSLSMVASMGWRRSALLSLAQFWAWGLLTPLIVAFDRRLPFTYKQVPRRAAAHLLASLFFTSVYIYVFFILQAAVGVEVWGTLRFSVLLRHGAFGWFVWSGLIYWMIVGAIYAVRYYESFVTSELRLERVERSFSEARLNALRMQLDPHFLFNALNTISSHVERDPKLTRRMIEHLGDLLRMSLESKDRKEIPLAEEVAFLEHYLEIQKIRFGSNLRVDIDVAPEVRHAMVPAMILQPLVENAIRHGISRRVSGGSVSVSADRVDGHLAIAVLDDGVGLPPGWSLEVSAGLGLAVTRQRIEGLHPGGSGSLTVERRKEGGTDVEISLPLRVAGEEPDVRKAR